MSNINGRCNDYFEFIKTEDEENKTMQIKTRLTDLGMDLRKNIITNGQFRSKSIHVKNLQAVIADTDGEKLATLLCAIANNGFYIDKATGSYKILNFNDLAGIENYPLLFGEALTYIVHNTVNPVMIGTSLLRPMTLPPNTVSLDVLPMNVTIEAAHVSPEQEYPTGTIEFGGQTFMNLDKVGTKFRINENLRNNPAGLTLFEWLTSDAVQAIYRLREKDIFSLINNEGTVLFDNTTAGVANTTGRNSAGVANGAITQDDILSMCISLIDAGYNPDIILMSPLAWLTFSKDPYFKQWSFWNAPMHQIAPHYQGDPGNASQFSSTGKQNLGSPFTPVATKTTYLDLPSTFPYPLRVVVSPYMPVTSTYCTIVVADSSQLGIYAESQPIRTVGWEDVEHEMMNVKWDMQYGLMYSNQGAGVRLAKGVRWDQTSYYFDPTNTFNMATSGAQAVGTDIIVS